MGIIIKGTKMKMTQLFREEEAVPVTPIALPGEGDAARFAAGERVKVSGTSKGKGFQGVVKRHGFRGGPKTHGQKNRLRAPGSIGNTTPQRVIPGRHMAGHMGVDRVTVKNLEVVQVDMEKRVLFLRGAVPGNTGGKVEIAK